MQATGRQARDTMTDTQKTTETNEPASNGAAAAGSRGALSGIRLRGATMSVVREVALLPALVVLVVVGSIVSPVFLNGSNLTGIGQQISALGVIVVGESLILLTGGIDLSLESTYGFAPMLAGALILPAADFGFGTQIAPALGLLVLVLVGIIVGLVNGLLIVKARLNGFIVTLAMVIVLEGLQNGIVKGQSLFSFQASFTDLGAAQINGFPVSLIA